MSRARRVPAPVRALLKRYWRVAGVRPFDLAAPLALILIGGLFEAFSFGLLIPLTHAVEAGNFSFLDDSRTFGWLAALVPDGIAAAGGRDRFLILLVIFLIIAGRLARLATDYARRWFTAARNERFRAAISDDVFRRVLSFGRQYFNRNALGGVDAEVGWAAGAVRILEAAENAAQLLVGLAVKFVIMLGLSVPHTIAFALVGPVVAVVMRRIEKRVGEVASEAAQINRQLRREALDLLASVPLLKAYAREEEAADRYAGILQEQKRLAVRRLRALDLRWPLAEVVILTAMLLVEGVIIYTTGDFRPGDLATFAAFLLLLQQSFPEFERVTALGVTVADELPRLEAVAELYDDAGKAMVPSGSRPFETLREGISVKGLTFAHVPGQPVLRDVHAWIPAGRVTAIVGRTGSGKSTLVDLIARFYDVEPGRILFDGVDVRSLSLSSLQRRMAVVSQDVWLLNRSIRENLLFGLDRTPGERELDEALDAVELGDFVAELPHGLDTEVGDRGVRLSGGQRQRIAIARALLREPEILILDEATSALDSVVERRVEAAIEQRMRDRTLIVVAHRLSTVRNAHHVLVMEEGRVVEAGSWDHLLARGSVLPRLYDAQMRRADIADVPER